ncbi:testis-expressed protein 29 isoform X2 [Mauremys reevesii]|uniref:testis-expressed protein 29 isoform X2 n=1 Tax=Mauremys reevesii TaxID=260615 RepID=UPI00193ECCFE|nr:testis-expressed protein 29 isoform X2 [Mauremys reevesii]
MPFHKLFSLVLPTKRLQVPGLNPQFIFFLYFLTVCCLPCAFVKFPPNSDSKMKSAPFVHLLKKRSTHFLRHGFAVCELPLYEICSQNVSRVQCSVLGCCFHKQICYRKAVPSYMQVFIILILLIMGSFILFVFHRKGIKRIFNTAVTSSKAFFLVEKRRRKNMSRQKNTPELYPTATDFNEEDKEQLHEKKISSADSKSESQNAGEDE